MNTTVRAPKRLKLEDMTKVEQRVAVARDVVAQIKAGRYFAVRGVYVDIDENSMAGKSVETILSSVDEARRGKLLCEVCAVGAGIVSSIGLFNGKIAEAYSDYTQEQEVLNKIFTASVVEEIEAAFELRPTFVDGAYDDDDYDYDPTTPEQIRADRAVRWGKRWSDSSDRLEAIYTNLAENEGKFNTKWFPGPRTRLGRAMNEGD